MNIQDRRTTMNIQDRRTVPGLFTDLANQVSGLFRTEAQLARVEMAEKFSQVGTGIALIVIGAVLLIPAMVVLLDAIVALLVESGFSGAAAAGIVGGACLVLGAILALIGMSRLKVENLAPKRTFEQLQSDAAVAREQVR